MKTKTPKTPMLISTAAAARIFLKIASMDITSDIKCQLMMTVSSIIESRIDIADADFPTAGEEIHKQLVTAILRSAKAREAAARR
ncbi:MAG: hypothetical protein K2K55_06635, partial [Duncaniella sp.]|nr:hypothetical protein [Duncaniella sp.]